MTTAVDCTPSRIAGPAGDASFPRWYKTSILIIGFVALSAAAYLLRNTYYGDPTIYLTYARNIAHGDFFSFNPHEFSSGSTSPLWAVLLSVCYLAGTSPMLAKALAYLATLAALASVYLSTRKLSGSVLAASLCVMAMIFYLCLPGMQLYESPLIVIAISLTVIAGQRLAGDMMFPDMKSLALVGTAWALVPLCRPDAVIISLIGALLLVAHRKQLSARLAIGAMFVAAMIPSAAYYVYSWQTLGSASVSGYCRAFALKEHADTIGSFSYSLATLKMLVSPPTVLWVILSAAGLLWLLQQKRSNWFARYSIASATLYVLILTLASPVSSDVKRYFLPIFTLLLPAASWGAVRLAGQSLARRQYLVPALLGLLFVALPSLYALRTALRESSRGLTFDVITEQEVMSYINRVAEDGQAVLSYEVQSRYQLRPDVRLLSLDGITDGKVGRYLESGDMAAFLKEFKPAFWIANDAVRHRPYLAGSILRRVVDEAETSVGDTVVLSGISFQNIWTSESAPPAGFSGARAVYRLTYR